MAREASFHSPGGAGHFLGYRRNLRGGVEVVYDDGARRRLVFRLVDPRIDEAGLGEALRTAVGQPRVLPALYAELSKRAIAIDSVG